MKILRTDLLLLTLALALTLSARADAYLDPGSGSYMLQIVVAFVLGGLFTAKSFFNGLREKLTGKKAGDVRE